MKEYCVNCDVTVSGNFYVNANSEEEARKIVRDMHPTLSDLTNFYFFSTEIQEVEEMDEV